MGRTTSLSVVLSAASGLEVGGGVGGGSAGLGPDCARNTATPPPPSQRRGTQLPCSSARQSPAPAPAAEYYEVPASAAECGLHLGWWPTAPPSQRPPVTTPTAPRPLHRPAWCRPARGRGRLGHLQQHQPGLSVDIWCDVWAHLHPRRLSTASICCTSWGLLTSASLQSSLSSSTG